MRRSPAGSSRRVVAWLALFLLIMDMVAGVSLPAGAVGTGVADGRMVSVCTASGMATVDLGGDGDDGLPATVPRSSLCAACLPLLHAGGSVLPAQIVMVKAPPALNGEAVPTSVHLPLPSCAAAPNPARAPPGEV